MRYSRNTRFSRKARWAVPGVAVAAVGVAIAATTIPSAQAAPALPDKTPAQLLADVAATHTVPPLTGTVVETTSLGLPQLPQEGSQDSLSSMLTGSHTVKVYWQDARHFRLAVPQSMSETDVIRDGSTAWLWDSTDNSVTKFTAPAGSGKTPVPATAPLTPQQAANQVLRQVGQTTTVSVQSHVDVAGEAAYQLALAPKSAESTIGSVQIAIDGKTGVPLRLQVFAKGASTPAFQVGYTTISYTAPAAANYEFTPPAGAKVETPGSGARARTGQPASDEPGLSTYGQGWLSVAELPQSDLLPSGTPSGSSSSSAQPGAGNGLGSSQEMVSALLGAAKPVSGSWGSGQLLHTSLLNVLITGGKVYVGAVDPGVLENAVGHATSAG
jgi:outer membrane lipoprotein-sorting protein